MAKPPAGTTPMQQAHTYGVGNMHRHLLLCPGPDCSDLARGEISWNYLKKRISELKLDRAPVHLFRTRCNCLRICIQGPIAVVQPDGVWYHSADPPVIERILQEHVLEGRVVEDFAFVQQPLGE